MYSTICVLLLSAYPVFAHFDPAYFRRSGDGFRRRTAWMKNIDDDIRLSELAIPGTHNSGSFTVNVDSVTTQVLNFTQQLQYGIRAFDIQIMHTRDQIIVHDHLLTLCMFEQFLDTVREFLRINPSECVLVLLREGCKADDTNNRSLEDALKRYLQLYKRFYLNTVDNIELGAARGKFIILNKLNIAGYGLDYSTFNVQDYGELKWRFDLYTKWERVAEQFENARRGNRDVFYVNYLSAFGPDAFPYFVASGHSSAGTSAPRLSTGYSAQEHPDKYRDFPRKCASDRCDILFEGVNILARDELNEINQNNAFRMRTVGIVMCDFPGTELIQRIIENNNNALPRAFPLYRPKFLFTITTNQPEPDDYDDMSWFPQ